MPILPFEKISKHDAAIAGGKGASLGEMIQAGIAVPPGFVILAATFEEFLRCAKIHSEIDAVLHSVDVAKMHTVEAASAQIQGIIMGAMMPAQIAAEIVREFKKLKCEFVAVRSSATAEDSASAAWAGQLDSYLNTTAADLLLNVQKCWASLFTPRAIFYRHEKNLHETHISVAVVVQKMIASEVSGIAFSVHPVTQDYNQLIIEAGLGLGEAIVSGQITPDSYVVEKDSLKMVTKTVDVQTRGLFRVASGGGGNEWRNVDGSGQKLTDGQGISLAKLIVKIENHYGFAVDVEWAFASGRFYIVQSRPITTLVGKEESHVKENNPQKGEIHYADHDFNLAFQEYHPPLWCSFWSSDRFLATYRRITGTDVGFLYIVQDNELTGFMQADASEVIFQNLNSKLTVDWLNKELQHFNVLVQKLKEIVEQGRKTPIIPKLELQKYLAGVYDLLSQIYPYSNAFYLLSAVLEKKVFQQLKEMNFQIEPHIFLSQKLTPIQDTFLVQYSKDVQKIAQEIAKKFPKIKTQKQMLEVLDKNEPIQKLVHQLSEKYFCLTALNAQQRTKDSFLPDILEAMPSKIEEKKVISTVSQEIEQNIHLLRIMLYFKDEISTFIIPYIRFGLEQQWLQAAKEIGVSFEDLEQLQIDELLELLSKKKDVKTLCIDRKKATFFVHTPFQSTIVTQGSLAESHLNDIMKQTVIPDGNVSEIQGKVGYSGKVQGRVQIIHKSKDLAVFKDGNILVTAYTAPEFVPIMKKALAIVTDTGGLTSHAAIVSRELGIPCIVGCKIATKVLKNGDMVEVDAHKGIVRKIISEQKESFEKQEWPLNGEIFHWGPIPGRFLWSGGEFAEVCSPYMQQRYGVHWPKTLFLFRDGRMLWLNEWPALREVGKELFLKYIVDVKERKTLRAEWEKAVGRIVAYEKKIATLDLKQLKDVELKKVWDTFHSMLIDFWLPTMPVELGNYGSLDVLELELKKYITDKQKLAQVMEILTAPEELSFYQQEEIDLVAARDIKKHQEKYFWLKNSYASVDMLPVSFFSARKSKLDKDLKKIFDDNLKEVRLRKSSVFRQFKLPKSVKHLAEAISMSVAWQDERKKYIFQNLQYKNLLVQEVARRFGYSYDDLLNCWNTDISRIIAGENLHAVLDERKSGFGIYFDDIIDMIDAKLMLTYWKQYAEKKVEAVDSFSGIVACVGRGKVQGKVRIVLDPHAIDDFVEGDVLVAPMTSPEYVFAMKKACAIITDTGGLTSHAAIVSRELKKVCLVGCKIATKVLKEGDYVEVDGESGMVTILKKK